MRACIVNKITAMRRAQSVAEYSICLALVLAALLGMQIYVKRGLQGRYKEAVDHAAKQAASAAQLTTSPKQYEPYYVQDKFTVNQSKIVSEDIGHKGQTTRDILEDKVGIEQGSKAIRDVQ
ncbi:MAG: hypothetical protein PHP73_04990 [Candidatus Omnitrophica bacterium]|nr:hypothetical protein [Candidatus Omnitrophota bacterium]